MRLWGWGKNSDGDLGDNTGTDRSSPVQTVAGGDDWKDIHVGYNGTMAIKESGTLWTWGNGSNGVLGDLQTGNRSSPAVVALEKRWKSIGGANYYYGLACAIDTEDHLFTWGANDSGGLGQNDTNSRSSPVQVGTKTWSQASASAYVAGGVDTEGRLWMWGYNANGELGLNDIDNRSSPVQVGSDTDWMMVAPGYMYTMAVKNDGTLWGWGDGGYGKLGLGNDENYSSPVQVGSATDWELIRTGYLHSAGIRAGDYLYCWGRNFDGQLGVGDENDRSSPVQVSGSWNDVSCGEYHTAALKYGGTVWCWGANDNGQLGNNTDVPTSSPVQIYANPEGWKVVSAGYATVALTQFGALVDNGSCSEQVCDVPAFKCHVGVTNSCTCAKWKFYTAQCSRIQQSLGICSGTSGAYVPAITICNQRLF
jgi:alpha-tubulin suppressor-like RCC1 family protein